jgi:hypothetical protein
VYDSKIASSIGFSILTFSSNFSTSFIKSFLRASKALSAISVMSSRTFWSSIFFEISYFKFSFSLSNFFKFRSADSEIISGDIKAFTKEF